MYNFTAFQFHDTLIPGSLGINDMSWGNIYPQLSVEEIIVFKINDDDVLPTVFLWFSSWFVLYCLLDQKWFKHLMDGMVVSTFKGIPAISEVSLFSLNSSIYMHLQKYFKVVLLLSPNFRVAKSVRDKKSC